jgi:hypothetical protein
MIVWDQLLEVAEKAIREADRVDRGSTSTQSTSLIPNRDDTPQAPILADDSRSGDITASLGMHF